jgi:hypothetical protein
MGGRLDFGSTASSGAFWRVPQLGVVSRPGGGGEIPLGLPLSIGSDLDAAPVFMASSAFNLRYEQERWPKIAFADVKDYQKAAA